MRYWSYTERTTVAELLLIVDVVWEVEVMLSVLDDRSEGFRLAVICRTMSLVGLLLIIHH